MYLLTQLKHLLIYKDVPTTLSYDVNIFEYNKIIIKILKAKT